MFPLSHGKRESNAAFGTVLDWKEESGKCLGMDWKKVSGVIFVHLNAGNELR